MKVKKADLSTVKVIEILQGIYDIEAKSTDNKTYKTKLLITEEQKKIQKLIHF